MRDVLKITFLFIGLANMSLAFGQTYKLDYKSKDYGSVKQWKNDTTWFNITNTSRAKWFILPTFYNQKFKLLYTNKAVMPGQTMRMGVSYYTEDKGKFSLHIPFYISSENTPIQLTIKGKIIDFHPNALVHCPNLDPKKPKEDDFMVLVKDNENVEVEEENVEEEIEITEEEVDEISLEEYLEDTDTNESLNKVDPVLSIKKVELKKENPVKSENVSIEKKDTTSINKVTTIKEDKKLSSKYAVNNLVFLIDISGSMAKEEKLEVLKESMRELVLALRPEDKISVITYATRAKVLYEASSFAHKGSLLLLIDSLKADGSSYGKDGLDMAYAMAREEFIEGGNNTVLLATDGKFNYKDFSENKLYKQAAKTCH